MGVNSQRIYALTKANQAQLNALTISAAARQDVAAALNANKEVIVHQNPITYAGWTGEGYIVIDPVTGAGGYRITGGGNGSAAPEISINDDVASWSASLWESIAEVIEAIPEVLAESRREIGVAVAKATSAISNAKDFLTLGYSCGLDAVALWYAIWLPITTGFASVTLVFSALNPLLGVGIALMGAVLVNRIYQEVRESWACQR